MGPGGRQDWGMGNVRTLLAAFAVLLALGGCGGGGSDEPRDDGTRGA